jgi:hypothetical protein
MTGEPVDDVRIERGGWMANHPITGHPTHVVTREWFDEIQARLAQAERERKEWAEDYRAERLSAEARENQLREALERIVREAEEHWAEVDDLDDTGAHVGVARYEAAKAGGKSVCAEIARAALAATTEEETG